MGRKIAIIGAGISGVLACKYVLSKGFEPIVFESRSGIGGLWTKTIETTKLQTPKPVYQFSDFPWPSSATELFPDQHQVLDYVESYARHFDLLKHIKFNSVVRSLEYEGPSEEEMGHWALWGGDGEAFASRGKWTLLVEEEDTKVVEVYKVDFVILCIGRFSDVPNIPDFPPNKGPEVFLGEVIHSKDYAAMDYKSAAEFVKGKQVTIVGFQKSALDIAMECSNANGHDQSLIRVENPCTVLYKTEHWNVPDYLPWGFPLANLYLNRFSELLVHKPNEGCLLGLLATVLSPVREIISKFVESHIKHKLRLAKYGMVPKHSFHQEINACLISTVPEKFYDRVEEGSIILKKAPSFGFCQEGVLVEGDDTPRKTDLVILATGFRGDRKLKDLFVSPTFKDYIVGDPKAAVPLYRGDRKLKDLFVSPTFKDYIVGDPKAAVPLYRECVHPKIPQLAVIGFSESVSNLYTSEMRCRWLTELLAGTFKLPSIKEMEEDVAKWDEYMKRYSGQYYRRSCIGALHVWYNDQLCKDMGWNPKRKKGLFAELFEPYGPLDYVSP
ncbi:Flavin monooxygenase-like [Trema orientale]|uniref:Flavin-containing monooxygenase n=1 Tax=Trema orientale TaxID=63057 RepID=A0A2P5DZ00_TREOI|nr:Flavin monooxygenase-like [Trema orientale]